MAKGKKGVIIVRAPRNVHVVVARGSREEAQATHEAIGIGEVATFKDLINLWLLQEVEKHWGEKSGVQGFQWAEDNWETAWKKLTTPIGKAAIYVEFEISGYGIASHDELPIIVERCGPISCGLKFHLPDVNEPIP